MEIAPGIHRIVAPLGERSNALYLLSGDHAALLVDTGVAGDIAGTVLPAMNVAGIAPEHVRVVIDTHSDVDHMGDNAGVRAHLPDAVLCCGELDRPMVEDVERMIAERYGEFAADHHIDDTDETKAWFRSVAASVPVDIGLVGGERIRLGADWVVEVLHTPGHSWGSVSIWDPRSRSVIVGDAVLGSAVPLSDGTAAFPPTYRYLEPYLATIGALEDLDAQRLLTSHYPVAEGAAVAGFLAESRAFTERLDAALRSELARGPRTLEALTQALGREVGTWPDAASPYLCYPLLGHLERSVAAGAVRVGRRDGRLEYGLAGAS
jgi:glyoxylase-like metal-dependent hydrolase (beta-lactamase superfamily II)